MVRFAYDSRGIKDVGTMIKNQKYYSSRGQSLVEMAITLPVFLLIVFTFIDLGRAIYYNSALGNAVREGARFASVTPNLVDAAVKDQVISTVTGYSIAVPIASSAVDVWITQLVDTDADGVGDEWTECTGGIDDTNGCVYVTVSATFPFNPVTPFLEKAFGSPGNQIDLSTESTMLLTPFARQ